MRRIIIASGKGGVGKSTISCAFALFLVKRGHKVGILDLDIQGSSIIDLLRYTIHEKQEMNAEGFVSPVVSSHGIHVMSIELLMPSSYQGSIAWRGLMLQKFINVMCSKIAWPSDLDILIIDTPPGTHDVHLSLFKKCSHEDDIVIIFHPHELSLKNALKTEDLVKKMGLSISCLIENMSYYYCASCKSLVQSSSIVHNDIKGRAFTLPYIYHNNIEILLDQKETQGSFKNIVTFLKII